MKRPLLLAMLSGLGILVLAQEGPVTLLRQYATQQYMRQLTAEYPAMVAERSAIERHTFDFLRYGLPDTPTVQVVFHLVGSAAANINELDVQVQLEALNRDFHLPSFKEGETSHPAWKAEGFEEVAARPSIRFCLAKEDPMGQPTSGMLYVASPAEKFPIGTDITRPEAGGSAAWAPDRYLNVWVAPLTDERAGFAQMPGGPKESDGIVVNPDFFARAKQEEFLAAHPDMANYVMGRTVSHLVGSYLNLHELWDDARPCADDQVQDTPPHNAPNYGKPGYRHISTCTGNPVEMTMNLMDNTDDEAQFMFTNMQMMRLYAALAPSGGPRAGLRTAGCGAAPLPGGPVEGREDGQRPEGRPLGISVYPNPASEGFTVLVTAPCEGALQLTAHNELGQLRHEQSSEGGMAGASHSMYVDARGWSPGMYVVRLRCGTEVATAKVMLEKQ